MPTLLAFVQELALITADVMPTSIETDQLQHSAFVRKALAAIDDALTYVTTSAKWSWLTKTVPATSNPFPLTDSSRILWVRDGSSILPFVPLHYTSSPVPCYTLETGSQVRFFNVPILTNVVVCYESYRASVTPRLDVTSVPIPNDIYPLLKEYAAYLLAMRHMRSPKQAQSHKLNFEEMYGAARARDHRNRPSLNVLPGTPSSLF